MNNLTLAAILCLPLASACFAQQKRDLTIDKDAATTTPPVASFKIPRSYAVVIGIANYASPDVPALHFTERDVESIFSILISPEGGNFHWENVHKLVGAKATLANMRRELEQWLPSVAQADDRVLVYFAGHGFISGGQAYLAPYDFKRNDVAQTGYRMDILGSVFASKVKARWKVLMTDACHSGAIKLDSDAQAINRSLLDLSQSLFSLTASRDREQSLETPELEGGHGVFTYYVVEGLKGQADADGNGIVTADELADYVRRNVRDATGAKQNPTAEGGSFDANMPLAFVPSSVKPGAPPPPKFGSLIFESNLDGVEVFLDGKSEGIVDKSTPRNVPGLLPGTHTIKGVKMGYEPDGPRDETVYPGQETTVTIKILIPRRRNKAAVDHLDKGLEYYTKGLAENYKKAAAEFQQALSVDPQFSQAALYLGRADHALFQEAEAEQSFRKAIAIDPDYLEARASFAGMLLDTNNLDEAARQLNVVVQRDPSNAMSLYLLSNVLCRKQTFAQAIEAGQKAVQLTPNNAEAHFWLAESLRMSKSWERAKSEYETYLRLSNFDSGAAGKLNYYVLGYLIGLGKKTRASQQDIWKDLRSWAYFGLCNCEKVLRRYDQAIADCQRSLSYDPQDALTHYELAFAYEHKANETGSREMFAAAREHFSTMLRINPDLAESNLARANLKKIDDGLRQ